MPAASEQKTQWSVTDKAAYFAGRPPFCTGRISIQNRSTEKLKIKGLVVTGIGPKSARGTDEHELQVFAKAQPQESVTVPAQLVVPPQTPPGRYTGEILAGSQRVRVTLDVLESWDLVAQPGRISLKVRTGERPVRNVILTNQGNMPYTLRRTAFAPLHDQDGIHRSFFLTLKNFGKDGYETVLNEFSRELSETEVEPATVRILTDLKAIAPGATERIEAQFSFRGLKKHRLYAGKLQFENAEIILDVECIESPDMSQGGKK